MHSIVKTLYGKTSFSSKCILFAGFIVFSLLYYLNISYVDFYAALIEPINEGHPFHLANNNSGYLEYVPYYDVLGDHGIGFILSGLYKLFSLFPSLNEYEFTGHEVPIVSFCIFALIDIALLWLPLPHFLMILSQMAFLLSIFQIDTTLVGGYSGFRAMDGLIPLLISLVIALLILDSSPKAKYRFLVLGVIAGFLCLFRQTASFIFQLSVIGIFCGSFIFITKNWRESLTWHIVKKLGWTYFGFLCSTCTISLLCTFIYDSPLSISPPMKHGSGQPLFCSLGYVENPYNIAWEDDNSLVNSFLIYDGAEFTLHEWADALEKFYWKIVKKDPLLFLKNAVAKFKQLNEYILNPLPNNGMDIASVSPNWTHTVFYICTLFYLLGLFGTALSKKISGNRESILILGTLVLLIASAAPSVIVFPGYYASFIGFVFSASFILLPLYFLGDKSAIAQIKLRKRGLAVLLGIFCAIFGVTSYKNWKNQIEAKGLISDANPLEKIDQMGYEYGYLFNRLGRADQEKILSKLLKNISSGDLFSPMFMYSQKKEGNKYCHAHVIAYLSEQWTPPVPRADQGPVGSYILLTKGDRTFENDSFEYCPKSCVYQRIADATWNGKYVFLTIPVSKEFLENPEKTYISAWEMLYDEGAISRTAHRRIGETSVFP